MSKRVTGGCHHHRLTRDCPECAQGRADNVQRQTSDPTDQARQAVVAAAVALEAREGEAFYTNEPVLQIPKAEGVKLMDAVRALNRLTTPADKRPEGWYWLANPNSQYSYEREWRPAHLEEDERVLPGWQLGPRIPLPEES